MRTLVRISSDFPVECGKLLLLNLSEWGLMRERAI
jgi:hypothetical protein